MEKSIYELTNPQKAIWLTEKYYRETAINTICGYVFISDKVDLEALKTAIREVVKANDGMRIRVLEENGTAKQYIKEYTEFDIDTVALKNEAEIEKEALKMANTPFFQNDEALFQFIVYHLPNGSGGFIVNVHHLIGDSWSLGLIAKEVTTIYTQIINKIDNPKDFPSYTKYIEAEEAYKKSDKWEKDKVYWNEVFETIPEIASLVPGKKEAKKEISCVGKREKFTITPENLTKINEFCNKYKISAYNFFMAIYSLYVSRVSGLDNFVMGTPILNRTNFEQKHTMGMFISVAPLRVKVENETNFTNFAKKIGVDTMSIFRHQKYSYQSILEDLRKKDPSIPNLYNVILSYQITKTTEEENGVKYITDWVFNGNSSDELQIHLFDLNEESAMTIAYDYNAELLNSKEITQLHHRILNMIHQVLENETIKLQEIEIMTPEEKHQILHDFNHTYVSYPRNKTIVDLFEEQVERVPEATAVVFEGKQLTYRELNQKANQLAHKLVEKGVKTGDVVGIYLDKSLEVITSMFATLKAGAAFLPMDTNYPEDRLNYIIDNSKPKLVLTSKKIITKQIDTKESAEGPISGEEMASTKTISKVPTVLVDLDEEVYQSKQTENLKVTLSPEDLMYVMYTSGSTGNPKGVAVKHKNIIRLAAFPNFIKFSKNEVMVQTGTIVFDACIFEIFGSLLHGFKLHILKKENILDINYFAGFLKQEKVTILFLTTGLFNELGLQNPSMFQNLKYLLTGGDVISKNSIQKIKKVCPNLKIINCYGPTENGSYSTCYEVTGNEEMIPIGKPITNSTAYVVSNGKLCPIGVQGELWVGGDGVAKGYLNREELTKQQFIPNPFGEGTLYKTGDLVKWLPDGNLEFIGRCDNQVKIRGFRIELAEIDRKILEHASNIKQSITIVQNINDTKTICTYIISDEEIDLSKLKNSLGKYLPTYMIPTFIMQLKEFPLNINGKVDKKAFPIPEMRKEKRNIVPARNREDEQIIDALKNVLNIEKISIEDSFFDLGGDSLSAITFTSMLAQKMQVQVNVNDVFEHPTIKELSDSIFNRAKNDQKHQQETIKKAKPQAYYPASNAQKRIYYASQVEKDSVLYNIAGGIIVDKLLDIKKLEECFKTLIQRHESLRTHFEIVENEIVQVIEDKIDFTLETEKQEVEEQKTEKQQVAQEKREAKAGREKDHHLDKIYESFVQPFDLGKAPLFRAKVVNLKNDQMLLLLDMHHTICDGTSLSILLQELCELYNGKTLPEKQIDYKDFCLWEKEQIQKEEYQKIKEFWVKSYEGEVPLLNMPTTYTRPALQSFEGANFYAKLPKEMSQKINKVSKKLEMTPYMLLLSAYYILLSKYTMQEDIVVGTPVANREVPELSSMFGMFVNTLPLRKKVDSTSSFGEFAKTVKEYCIEAFKNGTYPFDELVKELKIKKDTSRNALFDVAFIYQNNGYPKLDFDDIHAKYYIPEGNTSKFDISLEIVPEEGELSLRYEYCTKLYDEKSIKNLSEHYNQILTVILENTDVKIAEIDMVTEEEKQKILYDFNHTHMDYQKEKTIIDLFEEQAKMTPEKIAIIFENQKLTYRELNQRANKLASKLLKENIKRNDIVGIMLNRCPEMIISILAVLKAGMAYLPIDPEYPIDRICYMLEDSGARIVLVHEATKTLPIGDTCKKIDVEENVGESKNINHTNPADIMYLIYTSGSTGKPKGVAITHKNITNFVLGEKRHINFSKGKVMVSVTTICFDIFGFELWGALTSGIPLVLANEEEQVNPIKLKKLCQKHHVTMIQTTPSRYGTLLANVVGKEAETISDNDLADVHKNSLTDAQDKDEFWGSFTDIMVGGEAFPKALLEKLHLVTNANIFNMYGPTETTVWSTIKDLSKTNEITIGKPIANTTCYILDKNKKLLPQGVPGELYIGGDGVAAGYWNRPKLTKERFIPSPFKTGETIYGTGDLAYINDSGEIVHLGRVDTQVKIRGYRIELSEIENKIQEEQGITECVVNVVGAKDKLCAYYTSTQEIDISKTKANLSHKLPNYMIPNYFMRLEEMPHTPNGKIDRKKLPAPKIEISKEIVTARNKMDEILSEIWKELLKLDAIDIEESLYDLGGDSLTSIQIVTEIEKQLGIAITIKDIFGHPTIKELSDYISTLSKTQKEGIMPAPKMKYYPASNAQKRIYYASHVEKDSVLYNIAGGMLVDKVLDIRKLEECFKVLIQRHEALRTHFSIVENDIVQIVEDKIDFMLKTETQENNDIKNIYESFIKPFDLAQAPLFRAKAVTLKDGKMLILLDMHHTICDGTSSGILVQELCKLYNGEELPEKKLDYKDFCLWEKEQVTKPEYQKMKEFWVGNYQDEVPLLNMPTTYARPAVQSFEGANYFAKLPKEVFKKVNELSKKLGMTPYMLMLSVYYILLSKYSMQEDITIGTPVANRELPELSQMVGMFVNTLALKNKVDQEASFEDFANKVKEYCIEAFANQNYPFDELVKELNIKRDTSRNPLFDVMFIYQNEGYPQLNLENAQAKYDVPESHVSKFDLSLEIVPKQQELMLRYEYCTKLYDEEFIQRLSEHYNHILKTVLENPEIKIANIDMLLDKEKDQILEQFNHTNMDYDREKTIVDLFEKQVEKTPDAVAVVFEKQQLTYRELNEKANQLARCLKEKGVLRGSIVGIMLPRCIEMMIGILGVLKTGACYIPIDPTFPQERIEYMLEDSKAVVVLKVGSSKEEDNKNTINIDLSQKEVYQGDTKNLSTHIEKDTPAYIIYTSGSTGKPKGVVLKHRSLTNLTCYLNGVVEYLKEEKPIAIASITTISFDIFIFETIISLQKGLTVVIANEAEQTNPNLLDRLIEKHDIKAIQMTPSRMEIFMKHKEYMPHLSNLKYIILAGEALPDELKEKIRKLGDIKIYNGYGPSETTVFSTFTDVTKYPKVTIGRPLANTYMYVLDQNKNLCPVGIPGELYISGEGVGKGYLNKPELTQKSFIPDTFKKNLTMYKTGDLVKFLPNGELEYIGRVDNQVKIRGLRIELDEIQKWIMQYKDVNKVVLSATNDKQGRQYLVAYLTIKNRISVNNLKIYLGKHIPKYMIPTHFMILDEFPYLPNGKIDKKALPLPNEETAPDKKYVAPSNKLEIEITQIFESLLSISPISVDDNFFDIGGDSLLAMSLQLELLKLQIYISYADIFMYPTVREMADYISSSSKKSLAPIDAKEMKKFDKILKQVRSMPKSVEYKAVGNLLLTGVTGFLGAHILDSFLKNEKGAVYCLIRTEPGLTIEQKLTSKLHYYFGEKYDNLIGNRIVPIKSDISMPNLGLTEEELQDLANKVDVVVGSAAKVSHYGNYGDYKKVNVDAVQNLSDFCMKNKKRFYQISTISVSGNSLVDDSYTKQNFEEDVDFCESDFYINQSLQNVYVRSKFEAEKIVLNSILEGLDGYIIRVGNLMNRLEDGKFQQNVGENAFINRLITYYKIGCIPDYLQGGYIELTPVDCCAAAITKIIQYKNEANRIFHLLNHKNVDVNDFVDTLNKFYDKINIVNHETFVETVDKILDNPNTKNILSGLINDFDENRKIVYTSPIKIKSDFTIQYLKEIGFEWPELKEEYIIKFLKFFDNLNLLNRKDGNKL